MDSAQSRAELIAELQRAEARVAELQRALQADATLSPQPSRTADLTYRTAFHASPAPMALTDPATGQFIEINASWLRTLGFTRAEVIGRTSHDLNLFHEPDQRTAAVDRLQREGRLRDEEILIRTKTGELRIGVVSVEVIEMPERPLLLTVMADVTESRRYADALRRSEQHYRALLEALDICLCRWLPDTTLTFTNEKYRKLFGIQGQGIGQQWLDLLPDHNRQVTAEFYQTLASQPRTVTYAHPVTVEDGSERHYHWIDTPILDQNGDLVEFQSVGLDITERVHVTDALRRNQEILQQAQIISNLVNWSADLGTGRIKIGTGGGRLASLGGSEHAVAQLAKLIHPVDQARVQAAWANATPTNPVDVECRLLLDDDILWVHLKAQAVFDPQQRLHAASGIAQEITAHKQAEELYHAQRDLARILSTVTAEDEALRRALDVVLNVAAMDSGGIYLFNEDDATLDLVCHQGLRREPATTCTRCSVHDPRAQHLLRGATLYLEASDLIGSEACELEELTALASIPLVHQGRMLGCISVASHTLTQTPAYARLVLETVASEIANIVVYLRMAARLRQSEARYRLLAENTCEAVWTNDLTGRYTYFSPSVKNLWGYAPEELALLPPDASWLPLTQAPVDLPAAAPDAASNVPLPSVAPTRFDIEVRHRDGHRVTMEVLTSLMLDAAGAVVGLLNTARDVTESRAMAQEIRRLNATLEGLVEERTAQLAAALDELKAADQLKDDFLAAISHELRTPLTGIIGIADALALQIGGPLTPRQQRQVQLLQESSGRLLKMVSELLRYASLAAGRVMLRPDQCALREVCVACINRIRPAAKTKDIAVACRTTPPGLTIVSDVDALVKMLDALLDNAVKFTPAGGTVALEIDGDESGWVRLSVVDTGPGIPPAQLSWLFSPFVQGDGSLSRAFEGIGLGLAYVARMAAILGGAVSVKSEVGQGSRFTITLPQQPPPSL